MRSIWHEIKNDEQITELKDIFDFQDCCMKEMHYDSGAFVDRRRRMQGLNKKTKLSVLLQSKERECKAIELVFDGVESMKLQPGNQDYSAEIKGVYMGFEDGKFVWINSDDYSESYTELYDFMDVTWIKSQKAKWREVKIKNGKRSWYVKHEQDKKYYRWGLVNLFSLIPGYILILCLVSLLFPQEVIQISMHNEFKYVLLILVMLIAPVSCVMGIVKGIRCRHTDRFGMRCAILSMLGLSLYIGILALIICTMFFV